VILIEGLDGQHLRGNLCDLSFNFELQSQVLGASVKLAPELVKLVVLCELGDLSLLEDVDDRLGEYVWDIHVLVLAHHRAPVDALVILEEGDGDDDSLNDGRGALEFYSVLQQASDDAHQTLDILLILGRLRQLVLVTQLVEDLQEEVLEAEVDENPLVGWIEEQDVLQVVEDFDLDLRLGVQKEDNEHIQELALSEERMSIDCFLLHEEILDSVILLRDLVDRRVVEDVDRAELLDEWVDLMHLRKEVFKYLVGVSVLAAVVHVDEAGVEGILVDLRGPLHVISLVRAQFQKASQNEQLVVGGEVLALQQGDEIVEVDLSLKVVDDTLGSFGEDDEQVEVHEALIQVLISQAYEDLFKRLLDERPLLVDELFDGGALFIVFLGHIEACERLLEVDVDLVEDSLKDVGGFPRVYELMGYQDLWGQEDHLSIELVNLRFDSQDLVDEGLDVKVVAEDGLVCLFRLPIMLIDLILAQLQEQLRVLDEDS
jgi:hypothetical protein